MGIIQEDEVRRVDNGEELLLIVLNSKEIDGTQVWYSEEEYIPPFTDDKTIGDAVGNDDGDGIGGTDDGLTRRLGDNDSTLFALVHQSHQVNSVLGLNAAPFLAMANENEQHLGYTPADISNRNLRSLKENMYSSPSPFSKVKGTDIFKNPFHQANVHDDTNRNENDKTIGDAVGNDDGDGIGGTDDGLTRR